MCAEGWYWSLTVPERVFMINKSQTAQLVANRMPLVALEENSEAAKRFCRSGQDLSGVSVMKKTILALAAGTAVAMAAPAAAQSFDNSVNVRINQLQTEIQAGVRSGAIGRSEAQNLREHLRSLRETERQYSMDGLNRTERHYLNDRIRNLRQQINYASRADTGYDRYGDNQWQQSGWIDRNRDGYDDRDYDRDGRWDDDVRTNGYAGNWNDGYGYDSGRNNGYSYGGMGGPYDQVGQVCGTGRGIGGVLGALLGSDNCINVGERVSRWNSLDALPYQYRDQFRDTGGYYHRYLNGRVVQVDGRTGTVVRIYDVD